MFEQRILQSLVREFQFYNHFDLLMARSIGFGSNRQGFHEVIFIWINKSLWLPQGTHVIEVARDLLIKQKRMQGIF